jgi:hypothetical protein
MAGGNRLAMPIHVPFPNNWLQVLPLLLTSCSLRRNWMLGSVSKVEMVPFILPVQRHSG